MYRERVQLQHRAHANRPGWIGQIESLEVTPDKQGGRVGAEAIVLPPILSRYRLERAIKVYLLCRVWRTWVEESSVTTSHVALCGLNMLLLGRPVTLPAPL